jgi:hypothetical protein
VENKRGTIESRELLGNNASNIKKRGWSLGYVSTMDSLGRTIWIADAHRDDGKRYVVHADEKLTAFVELESAVNSCLALSNLHPSLADQRRDAYALFPLKAEAPT